MTLLLRVAALLVVLAVPLTLALAGQGLAARPDAPRVPSEPVRLAGPAPAVGTSPGGTAGTPTNPSGTRPGTAPGTAGAAPGTAPGTAGTVPGTSGGAASRPPAGAAPPRVVAPDVQRGGDTDDDGDDTGDDANGGADDDGADD